MPVLTFAAGMLLGGVIATIGLCLVFIGGNTDQQAQQFNEANQEAAPTIDRRV